MTRKINWGKWSLIIGTPIAIFGIIIGVASPESRCFLGLKSESCHSPEIELVEVDFIVQTEEAEPLDGVKVQFISKGAPEVRTTNSDGYVRMEIPSRGDIDIILSKEGFQTLKRTINLKVDGNRTKIYQLKQLAAQDASVPSPVVTNSPSPVETNMPINSPSSVNSSLFKCIKVEGEDPQPYEQVISVGRKPQNPDRRVYLYTGSTPRLVTCAITKKNSNLLKFTYAIPDKSSLGLIRISFYLDGKPEKSLDIGRGEIGSVSLNITNSNSYAIEQKVIQGGSDYVYSFPVSEN